MLLTEKSSSRSQQRYFGMVHACQKSGKCASPEVKKTAGEISFKDAEDFARTKHKGLPERKMEKEESLNHYSFHAYVALREGQECQCNCQACKEGKCSACSCSNCSCANCGCH